MFPPRRRTVRQRDPEEILMAEGFELTEEMKASIGQASEPWSYEVTTTSVRAFARGVGYTDPVYFDEAAAKAAGYRSLPAPPTYLGTAVFIPGQSDETFSTPRHGQPSVKHGLKNVLDGGTAIEYHTDICAGDTLSVVTRISDLRVKDNKSLGKMLFITMESDHTNQDGDLAATLRSQVIFY
jgi:acyl dehydratase